MSKPVDLCCYCGVELATTKDHIPPKAIFNRPRPNDLITVPACFKCNNEASQNDEKFKTYLGLHVARKGGQAEQLFKQGVLPTVRHNKKLHRAVIARLYFRGSKGRWNGKHSLCILLLCNGESQLLGLRERNKSSFKTGNSIISYPKHAVKEIIFGCNLKPATIASSIKKIKWLNYKGLVYSQMNLDAQTLGLKKAILKV